MHGRQFDPLRGAVDNRNRYSFIDTRSLQIVDELSVLIRPVIRPKLSQFCIELTRIKQAELDVAAHFPGCSLILSTGYQTMLKIFLLLGGLTIWCSLVSIVHRTGWQYVHRQST